MDSQYKIKASFTGIENVVGGMKRIEQQIRVNTAALREQQQQDGRGELFHGRLVSFDGVESAVLERLRLPESILVKPAVHSAASLAQMRRWTPARPGPAERGQRSLPAWKIAGR